MAVQLSDALKILKDTESELSQGQDEIADNIRLKLQSVFDEIWDTE